MDCAHCTHRDCYRTGLDCTGFEGHAEALRAEPETLTAARGEADGYMTRTRLEEIIVFARRMGWRRIGIAFCVGLADEACTLHDILARHFEVHSVCCKVGGVDKKDIGAPYLRPGREREASCNPPGQARVLNEAGTDLNLTVGLCVGHDMIFLRRSAAPVTPFVVKDRVLGHNPAACLYSGYHRRALENLPVEEPGVV